MGRRKKERKLATYSEIGRVKFVEIRSAQAESKSQIVRPGYYRTRASRISISIISAFPTTVDFFALSFEHRLSIYLYRLTLYLCVCWSSVSFSFSCY